MQQIKAAVCLQRERSDGAQQDAYTRAAPALTEKNIQEYHYIEEKYI